MDAYSRNATSFPLGIRLRASPIISKNYDGDMNDKIQALMQRQEWFQASITQSYYMSVTNIDGLDQETQRSKIRIFIYTGKSFEFVYRITGFSDQSSTESENEFWST